MTIHLKDGRTFRQACKDNGVKFWQVYDKIRVRGMSPEKAIEYVKNLKGTYMCHGKTLRQYCIENKVPYQSVIKYRNDGGKESFEEVIERKLYNKNNYTDLQFCKDHNIKYNNAKARHYYDMMYHDCQKTFKEYCINCYNL